MWYANEPGTCRVQHSPEAYDGEGLWGARWGQQGCGGSVLAWQVLTPCCEAAQRVRWAFSKWHKTALEACPGMTD